MLFVDGSGAASVELAGAVDAPDVAPGAGFVAAGDGVAAPLQAVAPRLVSRANAASRFVADVDTFNVLLNGGGRMPGGRLGDAHSGSAGARTR